MTVALALLPGASDAQIPQQRLPLIPGLPVPVSLPANLSWIATRTPPALGTQPGVPGQPPSGTSPLPPGAVDGNGYFTVPYMRTEAEAMLNELVAALHPTTRAKVQGIPFAFDAETNEVNAFAGCQNGNPFMAMTLPLARALGHIAEAKAADEIFGTNRVDTYTNMAAQAMSANAPIPDPPAGFYQPNEALDLRKLGRQHIILDEMFGFVLGHELAHHYLGHTGCAKGGGGIDPGILFRIPSQVIPVFNQPNEAASDTNGTENVLNAGLTHPGGLTEGGGVLTLRFFGALQTLSPSSVLWGVLRTHPQPQLRIPLIQQTAQQWRARQASGGGGNTSPANPLPFPFPFQLPFPR